MESWRTVWKLGFAPILPTKGLEALREALINDDPRLVQGVTTTPPAIGDALGLPVEEACVLGFCGWHAEDDSPPATVSEAEECFARYCFEADQLLGEVAACRWFLNWFDDAPRDEMRRELLAEVELELASRAETKVCVVEPPLDQRGGEQGVTLALTHVCECPAIHPSSDHSSQSLATPVS